MHGGRTSAHVASSGISRRLLNGATMGDRPEDAGATCAEASAGSSPTAIFSSSAIEGRPSQKRLRKNPAAQSVLTQYTYILCGPGWRVGARAQVARARVHFPNHPHIDTQSRRGRPWLGAGAARRPSPRRSAIFRPRPKLLRTPSFTAETCHVADGLRALVPTILWTEGGVTAARRCVEVEFIIVRAVIMLHGTVCTFKRPACRCLMPTGYPHGTGTHPAHG